MCLFNLQNFKVKSWPMQDYGKFYDGDSYIILNVRIKYNFKFMNANFEEYTNIQCTCTVRQFIFKQILHTLDVHVVFPTLIIREMCSLSIF